MPSMFEKPAPAPSNSTKLILQQKTWDERDGRVLPVEMVQSAKGRVGGADQSTGRSDLQS